MKTNETSKKKSNTAPDRSLLAALLSNWKRELGYLSVLAASALTSQAQDTTVDEAILPEALPAGRIASSPDARGKGFNKPAWLRRQTTYQPRGFDLVSAFTGTDDCPGRTIPSGSYTVASPYQDSGDTTGANNTVNWAHWIYYTYYSYAAQAPDHIYSFSLVNRGNNSRLLISTTSPTYRPMVYVAEGTGSGPGCQAGTGSSTHTMHEVRDSRWGPSGTTEIDLQSAPLYKQLYLFVDSSNNDVQGTGPYTIQLRDATVSSTPLVRKRFDFDVDNKTDMAVYRPSEGTWYVNRSSQGFAAAQFGISTDKIVPGDYDGDGKTDYAVYRDGVWYWINSSNDMFQAVQFGISTDIPVPADYSGDARDELAIYRNGQWWMLNLATGQASVAHFGLAGDIPIPADYDGDGRKDQAVFRGGIWHLNQSSRGYLAVNLGLSTDKPIVADLDSDQRADIMVYRGGTWYIRFNNWGYFGWDHVVSWGLPSDIPVPADYDGDGQAELGVYRNGVWWIRDVFNPNDYQIGYFGSPGDKPIPAAYIP